MARNILASLVMANIVERAGPGRATLRVTPRFMAHLEGTAGRLRVQGHPARDRPLLEAALATWDEHFVAPRAGAGFLADLLAERQQWGTLQPMFPDLAGFATGVPA